VNCFKTFYLSAEWKTKEMNEWRKKRNEIEERRALKNKREGV